MAIRRLEAPPEVRFWRKVDTSGGMDGCWPWLGGMTTKGYGSFGVTSRRGMQAHRFAYELLVGPVPDGLELDHLCRNKACVNPAHLEPVTHAENVRRGASGKYLRARTHCPHGHPYAGDNLIIRPNGHRHCRTCRNGSQRMRRLAGGADYRARHADVERARRARIAS